MVLRPLDFHFLVTTLAELAQQTEREFPRAAPVPGQQAVIKPGKEATENHINIAY